MLPGPAGLSGRTKAQGDRTPRSPASAARLAFRETGMPRGIDSAARTSVVSLLAAFPGPALARVRGDPELPAV